MKSSEGLLGVERLGKLLKVYHSMFPPQQSVPYSDLLQTTNRRVKMAQNSTKKIDQSIGLCGCWFLEQYGTFGAVIIISIWPWQYYAKYSKQNLMRIRCLNTLWQTTKLVTDGLMWPSLYVTFWHFDCCKQSIRRL